MWLTGNGLTILANYSPMMRPNSIYVKILNSSLRKVGRQVLLFYLFL